MVIARRKQELVPPEEPADNRLVPVLHRENAGWSRRPVRIVHIALGNFFRAHAAWYTERADPQGEWGIAGFTGRTIHLMT
jgi:fructuronate reductase